MRRSLRNCVAIAIFTLLSGALVGCDSSPNSVEDFDIQGTMDSPSGITASPDLSPSFTVTYQGLDQPPSASFESASGDFSLERDTVTGDPVQGGRSRWTVSLTTDQIQEALKTAGLVIEGTDHKSGRVIRDTIATVATTKLLVASSFTSSFMTVADYEGDVDSTNTVDGDTPQEPNTLSNDEPYTGGQRTLEISGGSVTLENANPAGFDLPSNQNNTPQGSNGVRWATVSTSGSSGSVTIQREMNLPNSDAFSFLIKPASQAFNLTLTFTEMAGGSEVSHEFQIPVNPGTGWLKLGIPFGEISQDFSPVDTRSGGNGKLVSITMTADRPVSFGVDQMLFGTISEGEFFGRAEFHDFERSTNAYGPPFCGGVYGFSDNVAPGSDGYSARTVTENASCFGYNYGGGLGPPALAFVDVDGNDVLTFYGKGIGGEASVSPYIQTPDGAGGFGSGVSTTLPADSWQKFEIPLDDLGSDPSALFDPGFRNVGFGGCSNCAIDDVKIVPKE